jgi:NAD(P)-dependent dehydrogenase (short-subunit alcohol dehydrogenase family)
VLTQLEGGTAVVTGGGSGIGRGMVLAWASSGMNVVVADIEQAQAEAVASEARAMGVRAVAVACDVAKADAVESLASTVYSEFGQVNVLCNNAGVVLSKPLEECTMADWQWVFSVNLFGVVHGVQSFLPHMKAQGSPAHIVNTSSRAGLVGHSPTRTGIYVASKHAVVGYTEQLRFELEQDRVPVGVSVLCPATVRTQLLHAERNRPEGARRQDDSQSYTAKGLERLQSEGMDPGEVGEIVKAGVLADRLYIMTHRDRHEPVLRKFANLFEAYASVPRTGSN